MRITKKECRRGQMQFVFSFTLLITALLTVREANAQPTRSGIEHGFWDDHAVVVAKVVEVKSRSCVKVKVTAVVATDFLIPVNLLLEDIPLGPGSAMVFDLRQAPGDTLLLCVQKRNKGYTLAWEYIEFFTTNCAIMPLNKGPDDPVLGPVTEQIYAARKEYIETEAKFRVRFSPTPQ